MKYIRKYIVLLFIGIFTLSSCNDWLSETPSAQMTSDELLENEEGVREALIGVYLKLATENLYAKNLTWHFVDKLAMPFEITSNVSAQPTYIMRHQYQTNYVKTNYIDVIWAEAYTTIAGINNILESIDEYPGTLNDKSYKLIKGELLALRAFLHLDLLRLYGYGNLQNNPDYSLKPTIPYVTKYSKELTPQLSHDKTIELLINDIREAISNLEDDPITKKHNESYYSDINDDGFWNNRNRRMNYYAAQALLARTLMWKGDDASLEEAFKIANELTSLEHSAYEWVTLGAISSSNPAEIDRTFSTEHLFSLDVYGFLKIFNPYMVDPGENIGTSDVVYIDEMNFSGSIFDYLYYGKFGNFYAPNHPKADAQGMIPMSELGESDPAPGIGQGDYRGVVHFAYSSSAIKGEIYYLTKFYQPDSYYQYKNRLPLIKISEMYYIMAEYYLNKGDETKALEILDKVRFQRGLTKPIDPQLIISVQAELTKEYMREFAGEGQLFYYYKRLDIKDPTYYKQSEGNAGIEEYGFTDEDFVLPYPDDEILYGGRVQ